LASHASGNARRDFAAVRTSQRGTREVFMQSRYEFRCPFHGHVRDLHPQERAVGHTQRCKEIENNAICGLPLYVADTEPRVVERRRSTY
jgi:hypothetical protein